MGKVKNVVESIIQKKGFGIWPKEVIENRIDGNDIGEDDALIKTLNIEYRFLEYLNLAKLDGLVPLQNPNEELDAFSSEIDSLLSSSLTPITKFITLINLGHIKLLQNQLSNSIEILESASIEIGDRANNYIQSLFYRKHYLLSIASHYSKNPTQEQKWLTTAVNFFQVIPTLSNIESAKWLHLTYDKILLSLSSSKPTISQIDSIFQNKNFILSFINHAQSKGVVFDPQDISNFVQERSKKLLSTTQFPKSDEQNNYELEEFLSLVNDSSLVKYEVSGNLLDSGINKTYQSHILLRSLTKNFLNLGKIEDALHSFEVYVEYIESYYIQNNHSFNDILGILNTFRQVLDFKFIQKEHVTITEKEYVDYIKILNKFKKLVDTFYEDNEIFQVDSTYNILDNNLINLNNEELNQLLSQIWYTLAISNLKLYESSHSIFPENNELLLRSINYFKNSIYNYAHDEYVYQYVKFIASLRRIREAYAILRDFLTKQTEKNVTFFKSWHLLGLIVSIEENKDESFKIINFLLAEVQEYIELNEAIPFILKETFVQIKITQLAIIEALLGIEQSLDSLPELFTLYNQLFDKSSQNQQSTVDETLDSSRNLKRVSTLNKIKSIRSHKDNKIIPVKNSIKPKTSQDELLQKIWILSATIYFKANLLEDSEQAIVEAEKTFNPTSETHAILGLITSEQRPDFALAEFEKSLVLQRDYPLGIIGLSKLILGGDKRVYITEKDLSAGIARIKILLELLVENFHNSYISEVWFLLSKIYEKFGDQERLRLSLWKSIELEETRPIRDFANV